MKNRQHIHQCGYDSLSNRPGCGHVWMHSDATAFTADHAEFVMAHTCPACGKGPWDEKVPLREAIRLFDEAVRQFAERKTA